MHPRWPVEALRPACALRACRAPSRASHASPSTLRPARRWGAKRGSEASLFTGDGALPRASESMPKIKLSSRPASPHVPIFFTTTAARWDLDCPAGLWPRACRGRHPCRGRRPCPAGRQALVDPAGDARHVTTFSLRPYASLNYGSKDLQCSYSLAPCRE